MGRSVGRLAARIDVQTSRKDQYAASTFSQLGSVALDACFRVRIRRIEVTQVLRDVLRHVLFEVVIDYLQESEAEDDNQGVLLPLRQLKRSDNWQRDRNK